MKKKQRRLYQNNKTESWFFEKINKIDKPLIRVIKEKKNGENQINKIRMKMEKSQQTTQKHKRS